jgi:hypothetical protein
VLSGMFIMAYNVSKTVAARGADIEVAVPQPA